MKALSKIYTEDQNLNKIQDSIQTVLKPLQNSEIINGRVILNVELVQNGSKVIQHKLGRELRGWIPIRLNKNATVWDTDSGKETLTLTTGASGVVVSLWVF